MQRARGVNVKDGAEHSSLIDASNRAFVRTEWCTSMEWINYHHLLYFWMVAREGGLGSAGKILRLSQSALSGQIKRLDPAVIAIRAAARDALFT